MTKIVFGPGSLEQLELTVTLVRHTGGRRVRARLRGQYQVACPAVGYDRVRIDETFDDWASDQPDHATLAIAARLGDADAASDVAHQMLDWALDGYSCGHGDSG